MLVVPKVRPSKGNLFFESESTGWFLLTQPLKQLLLKQPYSTFRRTMPTMDEKNNDSLSAIWIAKK